MANPTLSGPLKKACSLLSGPLIKLPHHVNKLTSSIVKISIRDADFPLKRLLMFWLKKGKRFASKIMHEIHSITYRMFRKGRPESPVPELPLSNGF